VQNKVVARISILVLFFFVTLILSLSSGAMLFSFSDISDIISGHGSETISSLFWQIRFPRIVAAFAVGSSLALAGTIMQAVFSNPLVEPYTLGLSGASSLGIAIAFLANLPSRFGSWIVPLMSFAGAFPVLFFLVTLGRENRFTMKTVLLSGVMISYICSSLVTLILTVADLQTLGNIVQWGFGSLSGTHFPDSAILFVVSAVMMILLLAFSLQLNVLSLGDNDSRTIGISPELWRVFFLTSATILTAGAVAVGGVIGFVGLLVPHLLRILISHDNRILVPLSWFLGGTVVLCADTVGRILILPREIPVGVIMGIVGGVLFFILIQQKQERL